MPREQISCSLARDIVSFLDYLQAGRPWAVTFVFLARDAVPF